ncbi:hypothetical protein KFE98_03245 [bacterium SCSIO 12741]|nr:hypothetical protein KFE98_03245 [bacterium SCSIO 12741]
MSLSLGAQTDYRFFLQSAHYTTENGLLSNECYWVHSDYHGHIWIASDNGLVRFDGQKFHRYRSIDSQPIPVILGGYESADSNLYLFNYHNRVYRYERSSDQFHEMPFSDELSQKLKGMVALTFHVERDTFWMQTRNISARIVPEEGDWQITLGPVFRANDPKKLLRLSQKERALFLKRIVDRQHTDLGNMPSPKIINDVLIKALFHVRHEGKIWTFFKRGIAIIDPQTLDIDTLYPPFTPTMGYYQDSNDLFVCTEDHGLWQVSLSSSESFQGRQLTPDDFITGVTRDPHGGFWYCSLRRGLFYSPDLRVNKSPEFSAGINAIISQGKRHFVCQQGGHIVLYAKEDGQLIYKKNFYQEQYIRVHIPVDSTYFINLYGPEKHLYAIREDRFEMIDQMPRANEYFWDMVDGKPQRRLAKDVTFSLSTVPRSNKVNSTRIRLKMDQGTFFATNFRNLKFQPNDSTGLVNIGRLNGFSEIDARGIKEIGKDSVVVVTKRNGVLLFHQLELIDQFFLNDGDHPEACFDLEIISNQLLIAGASGLYLIEDFARPTRKIKRLFYQFGLSPMRVNSIFEKGELILFRTDQSLYYFPTSLLQDPEIVYPLRMDQRGEQSLQTLINNPHPKANSLELSVNAYNLINGPKTWYRYRLYEESEPPEPWTETQTPDLRFPSLAPGTYILKIQTLNSSGEWEERGSILRTFTIPPPFGSLCLLF